jgi:hypothetical protein
MRALRASRAQRLAFGALLASWALTAHEAYAQEERALPGHVLQSDIEQGTWSLPQLRVAGERLFKAVFTHADGAGRPGATGNPSPTRRPLKTAVSFLRTAGPDANSCFACHNQPFVGGAGDFVANVFAGTPSREPAITSIDPGLVAERGSTSLNGSGALEMVAREMTRELHGLRARVIQQAKQDGRPVRVELTAKGISFGHLTGLPDGNVALNEIKGIDRDLVVRPWLQKGIVTSLRTFSINAMNQHHGMEASERFGLLLTGTRDFDRDGVADELSEGDITALVIFQASLNVPGRVLPADAAGQRKVKDGEKLFAQTKCTSCHVPELILDQPVFSEPGPYNLEGTLHFKDVSRPFTVDLTKEIPEPRLEAQPDGRAVVRAYTDFKRHRICDREKPYFCNENLVQGFAPIDQFITKRLWDAGNTAPYGHRGDLTTLREAILHPGGEARESRLMFEQLARTEQDAVVAFLKSMQILPDGSAPVVTAAPEPELPYSKTLITDKR